MPSTEASECGHSRPGVVESVREMRPQLSGSAATLFTSLKHTASPRGSSVAHSLARLL